MILSCYTSYQRESPLKKIKHFLNFIENDENFTFDESTVLVFSWS